MALIRHVQRDQKELREFMFLCWGGGDVKYCHSGRVSPVGELNIIRKLHRLGLKTVSRKGRRFLLGLMYADYIKWDLTSFPGYGKASLLQHVSSKS